MIIGQIIVSMIFNWVRLFPIISLEKSFPLLDDLKQILTIFKLNILKEGTFKKTFMILGGKDSYDFIKYLPH